jgi:hypothetical protein
VGAIEPTVGPSLLLCRGYAMHGVSTINQSGASPIRRESIVNPSSIRQAWRIYHKPVGASSFRRKSIANPSSIRQAWRIYHNPIEIKTQLGMRQAWRIYHKPMITIRILP